MKKIYLSLLALSSVFAVNAQLTQANHAPAAGDAYSMYQCDTVSPGASGANALWDFSAINTHSSILTSYATLAISSATFPAATVARAASPINTSYFNSTATVLNYYGGNISVGSGASAVIALLNYTTPAVQAAYPMSLNTTSASAIGGSLNVTSPISTPGTFTGTSNVLADGSGTLMLPGSNTFSNVIRVVTSQTINFATTFASGSIFQNNYEFYEVGTKYPLFTITTSTASTLLGTNTQTFVNRNKDASSAPSNTLLTGVSENTSNTASFGLYPNPANTIVNVVTNHSSAFTVSVFDITGKLVEKQNLTEGKAKINVSDYNKGLYLYTISASDNRSLKSGKFTVSQ